ncbi:glyoxylase-like metal-dependent hydrolase (beta-lactamase superfamily II) [Labedaea rhizosphaerae]|uniref:Glyoxylase-like metal-dependent hydrolase (Beta-lactamase superfamily II) n=1 Tax=Labedaea rhizosphaerae TaxID=598644 RepID=A0A4R6SFQ7_LABRH|nr:glyoxylase-like metal-dependent hydrolase (beta-lactamase superfamily II) [Labedaea rhizosphaerae]
MDDGMGNSAYLVDLGDGRGLAVDVSIDLRAVREAARWRGLRLAFVAETHLHADFASGARELAETHDTRILASAAGNRVFNHVGLADEQEFDLGGLRLRALATPGHTREHLSYLLSDGDAPLGVFTGGSLIVGSAARTDLDSPEATEDLTRKQYRSLQRLVTLPDEVAVWPTHGAGSFCSAPAGGERTSTIGTEKASNPLLAVTGEDAFVAALLGSLGTYPDYFRRLPELNRHGLRLPDRPAEPAALDTAQVRALLADGAELVDLRPVTAFADGHIPGALSNPLRPQFASWLGWLVPPDRPLVFVRDADQDLADAVWQAAKIGHFAIAGELDGGMKAWQAAGYEIARVGLADAADPADLATAPPSILDVRQRAEYTGGHVPSAMHVELGSLTTHADAVPDGPLVVMCGHGERAMSAASLLARSGHRELTVLVGGPGDWARTTGRELDQGT